MELSPAESATVIGRVLDPEGTPLTDFRVRALSVHPAPWWTTIGGEQVNGSGDGAFELRGLRPGTLRIEASAEGLATCCTPAFQAEAGIVVRDIVVRLTSGGTLTGRLVDGTSAEAVAGARVQASEPFGLFESRETSARTGADGWFTLAHTPGGSCTVRVDSEHHATRVIEHVHIEEGATTELGSLALSIGGMVTGLVRDTGGSGIPWAGVQLSAQGLDAVHSRAVQADEAGRFRIEHVTAGAYALSATRGTYPGGDPFKAIRDMRRTQCGIEVGEGEQRDVEITLDLERPR